MADNPYINKVVYDDDVLIDLTSDTVEADKLAAGLTAHDASGALIEGTVLDGDLLGYGRSTSNMVGSATAGYAVVTDPVGNVSGSALAGYAVLTE